MPPPPHPPHPPRLCLVAAFSDLVAFPSAQLCPVFLGKVRGLFRVRTTKSTLWPTAFLFSAWMMTPHLSLTSTSSASPSSPTLSIPPSSPPPTTRTTKSPSALKMRLSTTSRLSTKTTRRTTRPASRWRSRSTFLPRTGRRTTSLSAFRSARRLPCPFYFLEHDASLATTPGIREIDDMEPSCDSSNSSHYDDLLELISSSNLGDSGNTEPMDGDLLLLVEPMEEPLPLPEIQIEGIPLCLLDDAWECKPEHQHQHQHEYVGDAEEQCFWSDDSDETEPTPSWACMPIPLPSAFCKCANEAQDASCLGAARAWC
ncbi:hypothetical protein ACQY0O_006979 [Thecaphora frezii]